MSFPELLEKNLAQSLSDIYRNDYKTHYHTVNFRLFPVGLHDEAATHLKVSQGSSGMLVTRVNHDRKDEIIDCDFEYWRQDAVAITVQTVS